MFLTVFFWPQQKRKTMEKQPTGFVDMNKHPRVVLVGDLHGDMKVLIEVLCHAELISLSDEAREKAARCYVKKEERRTWPLDSDDLKSIRWTGGTAAVAFLGDVLDNKRYRSKKTEDEFFGVCATAGTQIQMIHIIQILQKQAKRAKGKVVWILGNHCVSNAIPTDTGVSCQNYAPLVQHIGEKKYIYTCAVDENKHFTDYFNEDYMKLMRRLMRTSRVVALLRVGVVNKRNENFEGVLAVHGGVCVDTLSTRLKLHPSQWQKNISAVNDLYWTALQEPKCKNFSCDTCSGCRAVAMIDNLGDRSPVWCRPTYIENPKDMYKYFGTTRVVKAHDPQRSINCVHSNEDPTTQAFQDETLCRVDIAMSRAFDAREGEYIKRMKNFGYLELSLDEDGTLSKKIQEFLPDDAEA